MFMQEGKCTYIMYCICLYRGWAQIKAGIQLETEGQSHNS